MVYVCTARFALCGLCVAWLGLCRMDGWLVGARWGTGLAFCTLFLPLLCVFLLLVLLLVSSLFFCCLD